MRKIFILGLIALLFWGCSREVKSHSEQELLDNYLAFHQKQDLEGAMALFYQKDTPPFVLSSVRRLTEKNFKYKITSAEIAEIPSEKMAMVKAGYPYQGKVLIPNLEPLKQIVLKYDLTLQTTDKRAAGSSIMFGKVGDVYYFVLSKERTK
jgi:hypothetical protein